MEVREWAERILFSPSLEDKLAPPDEPLTFAQPGRPERVGLPARLAELDFETGRRRPQMPKPAGFTQPRLRALAHHIMANHELQALEVMAWIVLAFPDAPGDFRRGLATVMAEEQRHTAMHLRRLEALGLRFGAVGVNGHVWIQTRHYECLLDYLASLPLTLEGANLDHSREFARHFRTAGDARSAAVMNAIFRDEIGHVAFGIEWLRRLKAPTETEWEAYVTHLYPPARPSHALGRRFDAAARQAAGLGPDFIQRLEAMATATAGPPSNDRLYDRDP